MHIVNACFPQLPQAQKGLSRLYAIRGRYPESSRSVNRGKNTAIGGSITAATHAVVRQIPSNNILSGIRNLDEGGKRIAGIIYNSRGAGDDKEKVMDAYKTAVEEKYRFFSFGDAMFIQ